MAALKDFAAPGLTEQAPSDLNRAVVSTLAVARNEYKDVARVSMQLGELPPVVCRVDEINQALLNIIVNAAQAVGERNKGTRQKGNITVRTWSEGGDALISVGDDGPGISPTVRERMFEPFFTTKTGGKNAGQGLALDFVRQGRFSAIRGHVPTNPMQSCYGSYPHPSLVRAKRPMSQNSNLPSDEILDQPV